MPYAAKTPCRGRCGRAVTHGYCEACKGKRNDHQRRTSCQRGYGYRWQKASKLYLQAHPITVDYFHDHAGRVLVAEVVDHIIPHRGDMRLSWDPSICKSSRKQIMIARRRLKMAG
jgi:5-methylcytosine-specific restriction protein A